MKRIQWNRITKNAGNYNWVIVRENDAGNYVTAYHGSSSVTLRAAIEKIISCAVNPMAYSIINPKKYGSVFTLSRILFVMNHTTWLSMEKIFAAAA